MDIDPRYLSALLTRILECAGGEELEITLMTGDKHIGVLHSICQDSGALLVSTVVSTQDGVTKQGESPIKLEEIAKIDASGTTNRKAIYLASDIVNYKSLDIYEVIANRNPDAGHGVTKCTISIIDSNDSGFLFLTDSVLVDIENRANFAASPDGKRWRILPSDPALTTNRRQTACVYEATSWSKQNQTTK